MKIKEITKEIRNDIKVAFPLRTKLLPYEAYNMGYEKALKDVEEKCQNLEDCEQGDKNGK